MVYEPRIRNMSYADLVQRQTNLADLPIVDRRLGYRVLQMNQTRVVA